MFTVEQEIPWDELHEQIRSTTLLGQPDLLPYANSKINLSSLPSQHFDDKADYRKYAMRYGPIMATSRYVLRPNLRFQEGLRQDLLRQLGRDQLSLRGGVVLSNDETGERSVLVPPIIEVISGSEGSYYVLDGAHRIWNDRLRRAKNATTGLVPDYSKMAEYASPRPNDPFFDGETIYRTFTQPASRLISAIVVHNPAYPSYARPNDWSEIVELDEVPQDPGQKKDYRTDYPGGYRSLYRDFSHLGSSGLRSA